MTARTAILALAWLTASCGGAAVEGELTETDLGTALAEQSAEPPPPARPGTIARADLDEVLARGPAPLLALVVTEPYREQGRFVGFRILEFPQGEPTAIDLREGDVILDVNGRRIERPEHLFEIFEQLKTADRIVLRLKRDGRDETLTYPIVP